MIPLPRNKRIKNTDKKESVKNETKTPLRRGNERDANFSKLSIFLPDFALLFLLLIKRISSSLLSLTAGQSSHAGTRNHFCIQLSRWPGVGRHTRGSVVVCDSLLNSSPLPFSLLNSLSLLISLSLPPVSLF